MKRTLVSCATLIIFSYLYQSDRRTKNKEEFINYHIRNFVKNCQKQRKKDNILFYVTHKNDCHNLGWSY